MKISKTISKAKNDSLLAIKLLEGTEISLVDAARLIKNSLDFKAKKSKLTNIQYCTKLINSGIKQIHLKDMPIAKGFKLYLKTKAHLRPSSIRDIKYLARRLFKNCPDLARKNFNELSLSDCKKYLAQSFLTAPQFNKAHRFLNGLFNFAMRQEWAERNIVKLVEKRKVVEKEIKALTLKETKALLDTAQLPKFQACQAPLALLLWAGIRPTELTRLKWKDIDLEEDIITIRPTTSKTGGARHIEICKPLNACLAKLKTDSTLKSLNTKIIPPNWHNRFKALRLHAGFNNWTQDVLRHTYASYHTKHFGDLQRLQLNMGHSNLQLLRTRYINLYNISKEEAKIYFSIAC